MEPITFEKFIDAIVFIWKFPIGFCKLRSPGVEEGEDRQWIVSFTLHAAKWFAVYLFFTFYMKSGGDIQQINDTINDTIIKTSI